MHRLLAPLVLLLPTLAAADVDPRFAKLRDQAEPLTSLSSFLENYIGECKGAFVSPECSANAKKFRDKYTGQKLYMIVGEDQAASVLAPGSYDPSTGDYTVQVVPLFAASGHAVTHGAPKKIDSAGNPVMPLLEIKGTATPDWTGAQFARMFKTRGLRVQVVFTPQGIWTLPKKGSGKQAGVKAKIEAVLVTVARTGEPIGLWLANR